MMKFTATSEESRIRADVVREFKTTLTDEQLMWWRKKRAGMADKTLMPQEHPSTAREAFISSGRHVFSIAKLEIMKKRANDPLFIGDLEDDDREIRPVENPDGALTIYKTPREGKRYFVPADVAEGVKDGCWSVAPVFDRSSWEVVAEIRLRCDPGDFGRLLCTLGEYYNWALLGPENNSIGAACLEAIKAKAYPHVLKTTDLWPEGEEKLGFPTDDRTKEMCISALRNAVDDLGYFENSKVAINEMMAAVRDEHGKMVSERARSMVGQDKKKMFLDCVSTRIIALYCLKFLTLDETYREPSQDEAPMRVSSLIGKRRRRAA